VNVHETKIDFSVSTLAYERDFRTYVWQTKNSIKYLNGRKINRNKTELHFIHPADQKRNGLKSNLRECPFVLVTGIRWTEMKKSIEREKEKESILIKCQVEAIRFDDKSRPTFYSIFLSVLFLLCALCVKKKNHTRK
jgi:hypothetical protein